MGFQRGNVPLAGFGAEPQYKSVGDTSVRRCITAAGVAKKAGDLSDRLPFQHGIIMRPASAACISYRCQIFLAYSVTARSAENTPAPAILFRLIFAKRCLSA